MTRLVLWHIRKTYRKRRYFLGIDRKGRKADMLIGFLSFPILSQIINFLVTFARILIFRMSMSKMIAIISRLYSCFRILDWPLWNWLAECFGRLQFVQVFWTQGFAVLQPGSGHCNCFPGPTEKQPIPQVSDSSDVCDAVACLLRLLSVLEIILPGAPGVTDMVESVIRCLL